jgi:hypothetical protein
MSVQVERQASVVSDFEKSPVSAGGPMKGCVLGPNYQLVRYATASEKSLGSLGAYNPISETCYDWPNMQSGAVVDLDYTRLFIDDALLQYFHDPVGSLDTIKATYCDSSISLVGNETVKNAIRAAATVWKSFGSWDRSAILQERDVTVGDAAHIEVVVGGTTYELDTTVVGFLNEEVAGSVGAATEDPNNVSAEFEEGSSSSSTSPSNSWTKVGFSGNDIDISAVAVTDADRPEHSYEDGIAADLYTITVLTAGAAGVATFQVTTDSGTDDVASVTTAAFGVAKSFGTKGVSVTFNGTDDFEVGMKWEIDVTWGSADVDPVSGGSYTGPTDTTYVVEVTKGASFAGGPPEITVTTTTGIDSSGPHEVTGLGVPVSIGSYGVTIAFTSNLVSDQGLYLGDKFYISATAASSGAIQTLLLADDLPRQMLGLSDADVCGTPPDLSVTLYIKKDIEVTENRIGFAPVVNWTADADEFCTKSGIIAYDSTWVDDTGELLPLPVKGGDLFLQYRALITDDANKLLTATPPGAGEGTLENYVQTTLGLGTVDPDNPLALGLYVMLLNAGNQEVFYIPLATDDLAGYDSALTKTGVTDSLYTVVPMSSDSSILAATQSSVDTNSQDVDGQWRSSIFSVVGLSEKGVVTADSSGDPVLATIKDDPNQAGLQFVLVETSSDVNFITSGVTAGDIVRYAYTDDGFGNETYSEAVVSSVRAANSLVLVSGPESPVTVAAKIEIWRNLTTDQMVDELVTTAEGYDDPRISIVWPDFLVWNGQSVAGYYLAAALAGLRTTILPHRSLEYIEILGFDSVLRSTDLLDRDNLDTLRDGGVMVAYETEEGEIYIRRAVTTSTSTELEDSEEVAVRNADSIRREIASQLSVYKGAVNLIDSVVAQIRVEVEQAIDNMVNSSPSTLLGPQLLSGNVTRVAQDATLLNRLVVTISISLPAPFSELELQVTV